MMMMMMMPSIPIVSLLCLAMDRKTFLSEFIITFSSLMSRSSSSSSSSSKIGIASSSSSLLPSIPSQPIMITFPLEECAGGCYCIRMRVSAPTTTTTTTTSPTGSRIYRAAVDTGSPYLVLSGHRDIIKSETEQQQQVFALPDSPLYPPTEEVYGSQSGLLEWKLAHVLFRSSSSSSSSSRRTHPRLVTSGGGGVRGGGVEQQQQADPTTTTTKDLLVAMMDDRLEVEAGGTLLGMIKHPNPPRQAEFYRPTWLQQQQQMMVDGSTIQSFSINQQQLVLSNQSLIQYKTKNKKKDGDNDDDVPPIIPLIDLRPLGDFIEHYCFQVQELILDGVVLSQVNGKPIVAVLDTGLTGCLLTRSLYDALEMDPRRIRVVTVRAATIDTTTTTTTTTNHNHDDHTQKNHKTTVDFISGRGFNNLFYMAPISLDWFYDESKAPHIIVLGQTFLTQGELTIDIEDRLATFEYI